MRLNRTAAAAILAFAAVSLPCASWFVAGSHEVAREVERLEREPQLQVRQAATSLAEQLATRLETLRATESQRPFYHYQSLYNDPKGAAEGVSVVPSPLAQGPGDPFIHAHFQIDAKGELTLPTLSEDAPEVNAPASAGDNRRIWQELRPSVGACVAAVRQEKAAQPAASQQQAQRVEKIDSSSYRQNVWAGKLYRDIKRNTDPIQSAKNEQVQVPIGNVALQQKEVVIGLGEFRWFALPIGGADSLVALREVETPDGRLTQGFVLALDKVTEWLNNRKGALFPARLVPGMAEQVNEAAVTLVGAPWRVVLDAQTSLAAASAKARRVELLFHQKFLAGAVATMFAGACVVFLVWQADRLARQRAQFAAAAAHELRTPLAGLRMYSEMLAEGLGDPARAGEYAKRIATESARLGRVVANVLEFTRLERGNLKVHVERGDLAAVVREAVERQRPALESAGMRIELVIGESTTPVAFDRDAVSQIVQNLLDNAEKYTRDTAGRSVRVSVKAETICIADNGLGLPPGMRRRLFEPFVRGHNSDAPAGLGLGLALVKELAHAQNAEVRYTDVPGNGAEFSIRFPA